MKIGIVGSRTFRNKDKIVQFVHTLPIDWEVVSGGCPDSVDTWAEETAFARKMPTTIHYPQWDLYGKSAGMLRNGLIVNDSNVIVAFFSPPGKGTKDTMRKTVAAKKPLFTITNEDELPTIEEILNKVPKVGLEPTPT